MNLSEQEAVVKDVMSSLKFWIDFEANIIVKKFQCHDALDLLTVNAGATGWYNRPEFTGVSEPRMTIAARKTEESVPALKFLARCGWHHNGDPTTTATDVQMRETLQYVEATADPAKTCDNCQLYVAAEAGAACGGCQIIKGPINPKGYCASWAAKVS